jgi:hypothetical protein
MSEADEYLSYAKVCLEFASNPKTSPEHRQLFVEMANKWIETANQLNATPPPRSTGGMQGPTLQ